MVFWSGKSFERKGANLVTPFSVDSIDCAALKLRVGPEVYVTPHLEIIDSHSVTKRRLSENESFTIPAGQFAFLLTEEFLSIPFTQIGFISVRAQTKFKGLVNVSGFHVDPGYNGRLIFSVYNAGPAPVHLQRGEELFLLWIADLDEESSPEYAKDDPARTEISNKLINNIPGEIHSFQSLHKIIKKKEEELKSKISEIDKKISLLSARIGVYLIFITIIIGFLLRGPIFEEIGDLVDGRSNDSGSASSIETTSDQEQ